MYIRSIYEALFKRAFILIFSNVKYQRSLGAKIGSDCIITPKSLGSEPYLIEIGNHVHITRGVQFINHDGGVWVFREEDPNFDVFGKIKIGNNVYIGNDVSILPGISIGSNCVIGARSVITKSIPDDCVVAGIPAKIICSTFSYKDKMVIKNAKTKKLSPKRKKIELLSLQEDSFIVKNHLNRKIDEYTTN